MIRFFAFVVAIGLLVGFILPSGKPTRGDAAPANSGAVSGSAREVVLTRGSTGHFFTRAEVNGKPGVKFIVDTGASIVALTMDDARKIGVAVDPSRFDIVGEGAGGPVRGQRVMLKSIEIDGIRVENVRGVVLESSTLSLLGQSFLGSVDQVSMSGDYLSLRDGA
ncbi:MAG: TIGR02281 family clan AA aspartic protease [Sphingomicrobium sp.]